MCNINERNCAVYEHCAYYVFVLNSANLKRSKETLQGLQRRKDTFDDYLDYSMNPSDYEKRVADFQDIESGSDSFKRARMGFHGMRGKRNVGEIYGSNSSPTQTTIGYQGIYINYITLKKITIK